MGKGRFSGRIGLPFAFLVVLDDSPDSTVTFFRQTTLLSISQSWPGVVTSDAFDLVAFLVFGVDECMGFLSISMVVTLSGDGGVMEQELTNSLYSSTSICSAYNSSLIKIVKGVITWGNFSTANWDENLWYYKIF